MKPIQCKMARTALNLTAEQLGERAGVSGRTVRNFEDGRDSKMSTVDSIRDVLECAGVRFIGDTGIDVTVR